MAGSAQDPRPRSIPEHCSRGIHSSGQSVLRFSSAPRHFPLIGFRVRAQSLGCTTATRPYQELRAECVAQMKASPCEFHLGASPEVRIKCPACKKPCSKWGVLAHMQNSIHCRLQREKLEGNGRAQASVYAKRMAAEASQQTEEIDNLGAALKGFHLMITREVYDQQPVTPILYTGCNHYDLLEEVCNLLLKHQIYLAAENSPAHVS